MPRAQHFPGQFIEIRYAGNVHRDYDYQFDSAEMTVTFKPKPNITKEDIILDSKIEAILRRNLFDFFTHRHAARAGSAAQAGTAFYGPPGTGKTHTCRYIHTLFRALRRFWRRARRARLQDSVSWPGNCSRRW
jgi:ATP-dependent 26S proteasome regulatory subunit